MSEPAPPPSRRPSVRLSPDEAWEAIEAAHTGIFTSMRRDGTPISLPLWFVVEDRKIWLSTPPGAKKVSRVRHNPRCSFLVETGERWAELKAHHLTGDAHLFEGEKVAWVDAAKDKKYAAFKTARQSMPTETRQHYEVPKVGICFVPDERIVSWDNARLDLK